uniref:Uncharacterized protein n=1 Tax=Caenorhabditis tropicalis TaxID=1561998 RepID=A0A1I7V146_9PELO
MIESSSKTKLAAFFRRKPKEVDLNGNGCVVNGNDGTCQRKGLGDEWRKMSGFEMSTMGAMQKDSDQEEATTTTTEGPGGSAKRERSSIRIKTRLHPHLDE